MIERLRTLPERWAWLGTALAVQKRFGEVRGGQLASSITLSLFLSLFPVVLVAIAVLGFFSAGDAQLTERVVDNLGLEGEAAETIRSAIEAAERSRRVASVVGLAGLLWSALGLVSVIQESLNSVWQVVGRGLRDKLVGLAWLAGAGLLFVGAFAVTTLAQFLPPFLTPFNVLVAVAVNIGLLLWSSKVLPNHDVPWKGLLAGAIAGGIGLEILKAVGGIYVPRVVASSSALYGSIGVVFAILAWLFFFARLIVYSSVLNVVLWERHHGTVSIDVRAPHLPGNVPLSGTRAGQVSTGA